MVEYRKKLELSIEENKQKPQISNPIGNAIDLITKRLLTKPNFSGYSKQWKEEMRQDAQLDCILAVDNFDPNKTNNPFAYFTTISWNAFIRRITKEKRQTYIKHKNFENLVLTTDMWNSAENNSLKSNEYSDDIIKTFEDKLTKTKNAAKIKAENLADKDIERNKNE